MAKYEKVRFAMVGSVNTLVDFTILLMLASVIGLPSALANIISTSCALVVSYTLNKKAVFGNTDPHNHRQLAMFIIVTLAGLWGLQTLVIVTVGALLQTISFTSAESLIVAKAVATVASLIWNYLWYSRVVFRKSAS